MKNVDLGEPTSCFDHVFLGCTQRECKANERTIENYRKMFESRISDAVTEKRPALAKKKTEQLYKVTTPCLDDHQFKKEELESVGEISKVC